MSKMSRFAAVTVLATILAACGGGGSGSQPSAEADGSTPSAVGVNKSIKTASSVYADSEGTPASLSALLPLHVEKGRKPAIKDSLGRTVLLRGVNLTALGDYYQANSEQDTVIPADERDFDQMAALGFSVVRLIVSWSRLEPVRDQIDEAYIDEIRTFVELAKQRGIYTVIDMHQDAWGKYIASNGTETCGFFERSIGWDGAPDWATLTDGQSTCRFTGVRETSPAVATAFENFWRNKEGIQDQLIKVWSRLAREFADEPAVAGYDLINEPNFGISAGLTHTFLMGNYYTKAIKAIRAAEKRVEGGFSHIAFFEPSVEWSAFGKTLWPIGLFMFDPNIVFAPHLYSGSITVIGTIESGYQNAKQVADFYKTPFWSGEWGWFGADDEADIWRYAQNEDKYQIGGAIWVWKQACGDPHAQWIWEGQEVQKTQYHMNIVNCPDNSDGGINPAYERVVSRAYPRNAPGNIDLLSSNPYTGEFVLEGITEESTEADIWVPVSGRESYPFVSGSDNVTVTEVNGGYRVKAMVEGNYQLTISY